MVANTRPFCFARICRAPVDDLNTKGAVRVLINLLIQTAGVIDNLRQELSRDDIDQHAINALLVCIMPLIQNWLNQVARFCQRQDSQSFDGDDHIYFRTYTFLSSRFDTIQYIKRQICKIQFDGLGFDAIVNRIEHESPWVGMVTDCSETMWRDIYVLGGSFIHHVIDPIYKYCTQIAIILAKEFEVEGFKIPTM